MKWPHQRGGATRVGEHDLIVARDGNFGERTANTTSSDETDASSHDLKERGLTE